MAGGDISGGGATGCYCCAAFYVQDGGGVAVAEAGFDGAAGADIREQFALIDVGIGIRETRYAACEFDVELNVTRLSTREPRGGDVRLLEGFPRD